MFLHDADVCAFFLGLILIKERRAVLRRYSFVALMCSVMPIAPSRGKRVILYCVFELLIVVNVLFLQHLGALIALLQAAQDLLSPQDQVLG